MRFWAVAVKSLPRTKLTSVAVMNWPVREAESSAPRRWDSRSCISSRAWKRQRVGWPLWRSMRQRRPSEVSNWQRLGLGSGACARASWLLFLADAFFGIFMGDPQFEVTKQGKRNRWNVPKVHSGCKMRIWRLERLDVEGGSAAVRRNVDQKDLHLSTTLVAQ